MSEDATLRQRVSDRKSPKLHDMAPVSFFSLVSPQVYLLLTLAYVIMGVAWYFPDEISTLMLTTPFLGQVFRFLTVYSKVNLGLIWFTIIAHIIESYFAVKFCRRHNFSNSSTMFYIGQTLYCGGFCLKVLFRYRPAKF